MKHWFSDEMEKMIANMALDLTMKEYERQEEEKRLNQIKTLLNNLIKPPRKQINGLTAGAYRNLPADGSSGTMQGFNVQSPLFELEISKNVKAEAPENIQLAPVPQTAQPKLRGYAPQKPELRAKTDINPEINSIPPFELGIEKNVPLETQKNTQIPPMQNNMLDINKQEQQFQSNDTPLLGGISINAEKKKHPIRDNINKVERNIGRALLPKRVENWFLGEEKDEKLINNEPKIPTYEELEADFKSGLISTEDFLYWVKMRSSVNNASADSDYLKERNKNIGKGVVAIGTAPIGGPKKLGKMLGTKYLSKILPKASKTFRQNIGQSIVDVNTSTIVGDFLNKIIEPNNKSKHSIQEMAQNYSLDLISKWLKYKIYK